MRIYTTFARPRQGINKDLSRIGCLALAASNAGKITRYLTQTFGAKSAKVAVNCSEPMLATLVLTALVQQKIPVGATVDTLGKLRPGNFSADRDVRSLPPLKDLSEAKRESFTGNVYIVSPESDKPNTVVFFQGGRRRLFDPKRGVHEFRDSLTQYVSTLDEKADVRVAATGYAHFTVTLPADAKKLDKFTGKLVYFKAKMSESDSLTIYLKNGKVVDSSH
jgi:hypothetical protein